MPQAPPILPRHLTPVLTEAVESARIVNLVGPRQVGKTTLVRDLFNKGRFITLDDETILEAIEEDPAGQLASLTSDLQDAPLIIDEAQRSTALALAMKRIVDADRRRGQFILTGSSNVFANADVADALPGRIRTLKLWPLTMSEIERRPSSRLLEWVMTGAPKLEQLGTPDILTRANYIDGILRGGFPDIRTLEIGPRQRQYRDYIDAIVDRDVADVLRIRKTDKLRMLIDQMAVRTGQELNVTEMAGNLAIKRETIEQYLDVLMKLSLVIKLGSWTSGESKREIKQPKYHFVDTGMASALRRLGPTSFDAAANPTALGGLLETFVFNELLRAADLQDSGPQLYHWRSADHKEIDIIADAGASVACIEIKASTAVTQDDFKHVKWFAESGPGKAKQHVTGIVFYLGEHKAKLGDRMFALPLSTLWAKPD